MVAKRFPIIDVDSHYAETVEGLNRYLDEPWRTRFANTPLSRYIPVALGDRWNDGRIQRPADVKSIGYGAGLEATESAEARRVILDSMERLGVQATLLV